MSSHNNRFKNMCRLYLWKALDIYDTAVLNSESQSRLSFGASFIPTATIWSLELVGVIGRDFVIEPAISSMMSHSVSSYVDFRLATSGVKDNFFTKTITRNDVLHYEEPKNEKHLAPVAIKSVNNLSNEIDLPSGYSITKLSFDWEGIKKGAQCTEELISFLKTSANILDCAINQALDAFSDPIAYEYIGDIEDIFTEVCSFIPELERIQQICTAVADYAYDLEIGYPIWN